MPLRPYGYAVLLFLVSTTATFAQDLVGPTPTLPPPPASAVDDTSPLSPRSTLRGFLSLAREEQWDAAANHLNLSNLPARTRTTQGATLARKLKTVVERQLPIDLEMQSAAPEGNANDGQPDGRDVVGTIQTSEGPARLYLERVRGDDDALEWRISRTTVAKIDRLYEEFGHEPPFADHLPALFFSVRFLDTALWQWIGLALVGLGSTLAALVAGVVLFGMARLVVRYTPGELDNAVVELAVGPLRLGLGVAVARAALPFLWLPIDVHRGFIGLTTGLLVVAATWFAVRIVAVVSRVIQLRMAARGNAVGISAIPLVRRVVNALVVLMALVLVLSNVGVNMTGVLAGLGVGGLAVALAAQKSLENLFGGITLIMDQPVHVGDLCRVGDRLGTVEDIGLRSTRIRTLERTLVTIPNAEFSAMQIENFARRDRVFLSTRIGVRYETTPDQLRYLLIELKAMLLAHPKVDPDPARVRFANFGQYSLDIDLFAYVRTGDYNEFQAIREDLFLRIMEIVHGAGTDFAFPSQTVYEGQGLDAERTKAAEAAVRRWRDGGELFLPDVPTERAAALTDTLDYPPAGSPGTPARRS
jgi:MscS family membrane protein